MLQHISIPAKELLDKIAKRRIGRILETLETECISNDTKTHIKKEIWDMKKDVEDILEEACYDDGKQ